MKQSTRCSVQFSCSVVSDSWQPHELQHTRPPYLSPTPGVDLNQILYGYRVEVRNRFKGLDLIDRMPDELWTEVPDIVQETGIKPIPMEKKCKKAKWLSEEALKIVVKRREAKSKGKRKDITI